MDITLSSPSFLLGGTLAKDLQKEYLPGSLVLGIMALVQAVVPYTVYWTAMTPLTCAADNRRWYCIAAMVMWIGGLACYSLTTPLWPLSYLD